MRGASDTSFISIPLEGDSNKGGAFNMGGLLNGEGGVILYKNLLNLFYRKK